MALFQSIKKGKIFAGLNLVRIAAIALKFQTLLIIKTIIYKEKIIIYFYLNSQIKK